MTPLEHDILDALLNLENAVATIRTADPRPNLPALFSRIDDLTSQLPPQSDPSLLHYLHKKSYQKARLFLEGRDAENQLGNCRHVDNKGRPVDL
ncbi:MAG: hypothetical protein JWM16_4606 [Verrucomicrobiales bacterium]|nr:hypothetical protein [Verrucomicrobiales bacterium]